MALLRQIQARFGLVQKPSELVGFGSFRTHYTKGASIFAEVQVVLVPVNLYHDMFRLMLHPGPAPRSILTILIFTTKLFNHTNIYIHLYKFKYIYANISAISIHFIFHAY